MNDNIFILEGIGSVGIVIYIYVNGQEIGLIMVDSSGKWYFVIISVLVDGENYFIVIVINVKGESSELVCFMLIIDIFSFDVLCVELIVDNIGLFIGLLQNNDWIDEVKLLFFGQGEVGNIIMIKEGLIVIGSVIVDENGCWIFMLIMLLSDGEYIFIVE